MCNMCERCDDELVSVHKLANIIVEILFSVFSCAIYSAARAMEYKRAHREGKCIAYIYAMQGVRAH